MVRNLRGIDKIITLPLLINGFEIELECEVEGQLGHSGCRVGHPDNWTPPEGEWYEITYPAWFNALRGVLPDELLSNIEQEAWQKAKEPILY